MIHRIRSHGRCSEPTRADGRVLGAVIAVALLLAGCDGFLGSDPGGISPPSFSHESTTFRIRQNVVIQTANDDLRIRYTNDGSDPSDARGTPYDGPIAVDSTTTIKAVAYTDNGVSETVSVTLTLDPPYFGDTYGADHGSGAYVLGGGTIGLEQGMLKTVGDGVVPACSALYDQESFDNFTASIDIQNGEGESSRRGLFFRHSAQGTYKVFVDPATGGFGAAEVDLTQTPGLYKELFNESSEYVRTRPSEWNNIAVVTEGADFEFYVNGHLVKIISDNTYPAGLIGPVMDDFGSNNSAYFDNLRVWTTPNVRQKAEAPVFNPAPGAYASAQNVAISTTTSGAAIRYTTNGSTPTESNGILYDGTAVAVSDSTTLSAIAYKTGMIASEVTSGLYTIEGAPAIDGAVVFEDDFQRSDLGSGWTITNCCSGIESGSYMYHDGQYAGGAIATETATYVSRIDAFELDFRIDQYVDSEDRYARVFLRQADKTSLVDLRYGRADGYMKYFDGSSFRDFPKPITGLEQDVWYQLTVLVDYPTAKFSVYVDGVSYGDGSFRNTGTETGSLLLSSPIYEHPGRINYDNVVLYSKSVPE